MAPAELTHRQLAAALLLMAGAVMVLAGLIRVRLADRSNERAGSNPLVPGPAVGPDEHESAVPPETPSHNHPGDRITATRAILLMVVIAAGSWLRLHDLTAETLSHTEAMVPGIWLPSGIAWPPARDSFYDLFWWHFHGEGHPQAYYFLMWVWTKLFDSSIASIRVPSVIFGALSIGLVFVIARRGFGTGAALLAAALLAVNGLHIHFSQYARMFAMASFLGLLSTALLLRASMPGRQRGRMEAAYVLVSWLGIYTQTFFWTVLGTHAIWTTLLRDVPIRIVHRMLSLQAIVVMLGAPSLAHIIYRGDDVDLAGPSMAFVAQYLSFGFAMLPDPLSVPPRAPPAVLAAVALALALALLAAGLTRARAGRWPDATTAADVRPHLPPWLLLPIAVGSTLVVAGLSLVVQRHHVAVAAVAFVPFAVLALPIAGSRLHAWLDGGPYRRFVLGNRGRALVVLLAFLPATVVFALSFWTSLLIPRAFVMFTPYLLIVIAGGVFAIRRFRLALVPIAAALIVVHTWSLQYHREYPNDAIDYSTLGRSMAEQLQPGDLMFVISGSWVFSALYPHLGSRLSYVADDYAGTLARNPTARVWLIFLESARWGPYGTTTPDMTASLARYRTGERIEARRAVAQVFLPPTGEP